MALNVKFIKGTAAQYEALGVKDANSFYYIDGSQLYLGGIKLSNSDEVAAAVARVGQNETDIKTLQDNLKALVGSDTGSIADMVKALEDKLQPQITSNKEAIDAINDTDTGILAQAKTYAKAQADGKDSAIAAAQKAGDDAQADVNALKTKVGTIPDDKTVVEMISDAQAAATYNDTEVRDLISSNTTAIEKAQSDAGKAQSAVDTLAEKVGEPTEGKTVVEMITDTQTAEKVTITTKDTTEGYLKSYTVRQGETLVGVIDIPKDLVVTEGKIVVNPEGQTAGKYIQLTIANQTNPLYINVQDLVDVYTAAASASQVQIAISDTNEISATIVAGSIGTAELADGAVTTAKIADGAVVRGKLGKDVQESLDLADSALQESDISGLKSDVSDIQTSLAAGGATAEAIADAKKAGTDAQASVTALDNKVGTLPEGSSTVIGYVNAKVAGVKDWTDDIATAKSEAISAAATDATSKANAAETAAKAYADGLAKNYDAAGTAQSLIEGLDVTDTEVTGQYVSAVAEQDGKVIVSRTSLPNYDNTYDAKGAADQALTSAKSYTDGKVDEALTWTSMAS